ncbi:MAG: ArsR family transcriptional regulator [Candidatus Rokuibacteriota bacterium]|nr:MAG: ArsR family transcriptional regulator [Candidatus Rokubacteria bacterium]
MWALAHPIRFRIWELLREGPSTASRLARRLGESRGLISYHLRSLARAGAIVEDEQLGTKRERWWRRPEAPVIVPTPADPEGRAIDARLLALLFARDEDARSRFIAGGFSDTWQELAFVGNWYVELTPQEADQLGRRLFLVVDELRRRRARPPAAEQALVSVSVLPTARSPGRQLVG